MKIAYNPKTAAVITTATAANDDILFDLNAKKVWAKGLRMGADWADISSKPSSLKNPYALTISLNGTSQGPYDGSADKSINITPDSIGAATSNHTHPYLPLSGGTVTGNIILKGGTSADMTYAGNVHPYIRFDNQDSDQNVSLIFTDWDTYRRPAGIKLVGNQGNEWFEAANIYATTFYGALSGNASTATKLTSSAGNAALPIYFSDGKPVACTASSIFSNLSSSSAVNLSVTVAGQNRTITNIYARYLANNFTSRPASMNVCYGDGTLRYFLATSTTTTSKPENDAHILHFSWDNGGGWDSQLSIPNNNSKHIQWRAMSGKDADGNYIYNEWKTLANITDNVASATKLQTARTIWGQSFDGTANVDNTLRIRQTTGNYCEGIRIQTADNTWATIILGATGDSGTNANAWSIHRKADNNFAISRNSSDGTNGLVMTSVGMGLGTTAPTHRLDVRGDTKITGSIRDLAIGGGIYWDPHAESASDTSDAASITVVRTGVAGGTTLVLSQMNDANDTIQFKTSTAAKLYHNSYPILTTQNTYVSDNKGYINNTEITQVNNADKVDNRHAISTTPNTGIIYKAAIYTSSSLTSYWVRLASIPSISQNEEFIATIHVQSGHSNPGRSAILLVYLRGSASSFRSKSFKICCNSNYDPNRFRLYYKDSDKTSEIWYQTTGQWDGIITTVISQSSEGSLYEGLTLYSGRITAVQTPSMSTYLSAQVSTITDNISGNAATATNADKVDGYHASSLWRSDGATWNPGANVSLNASANNQEWSFDIRRNGYTGCYWHVWDSSLNSMLKVNADNGKVYAPYNFVGNLEGNASSASKWTTARTFTIGNTAKDVDGSGNVSWSLSEIGVRDTWRTVQVNGTSIDNNTLNLCGSTYIGLTNVNGKVTFSLVGSGTTANQAILSNGTANEWTLKTLNIDNWDTAYNFVSTITGTDTDDVINKWDEIVNFLAGIKEDNKLNTLLNSKLSIQQLSAKEVLTTKTNNALFWVDTIGTAGSITTGPFTDHPYALLSVTNCNQTTKDGKYFYRSRLAFNSVGDLKVASCHYERKEGQDDTWYNVLTSKNSGINGSTIKLNGTSITVYSSDASDGRYVKKSGDTMTGALNFANNTWNNVGDDVAIGDINSTGCLGLRAHTGTYPGITFVKNDGTVLNTLMAYGADIKYGSHSLMYLSNGSTSVAGSTWMNPFTAYDKDAVKDGQAICVWGQGSSLSNLSSDGGNIALYLKRVNAKTATLNMVLDGEYYANGNQRLAHVSEIPNSLKNPHALTLKANGTVLATYDGSSAKEANFTYANVGAASANHNHDNKYLRLDGSNTMTGQIKSSYSAGSWIAGCTNAILKATADGYNSLICAPIKSGNICISAWTAEDNLNFGYAKKGKTENSFDTRMYWDAPNNNLHATAFTGHLYGTADNATDADKLDGYHASGLLTALSNSNRGISLTVGGTTKSLSNISVGDADTVDGEHASAFTRIVGRHSISTDGTTPYRYIHLFRIANSGGYSTVDCEIDLRTRYHSAKLEIRISTNQHPYSADGSSISIIKKVINGRSCNFWVLQTVQSSGYNYYDIYYESGAWNSGTYGIILRGSNGALVFEHKGTKLDALPSNTSVVNNQWVIWKDIAERPTSLKNPHTIKFKNTANAVITYDGSSDVDLTSGVNYASSAGSATSATKVIVNQHTANNIDYPLVWSNQNNTSNATENQLHKSWQDLYYNPKNKRLFVGGSVSTVNINATGTVTSAGFKHSEVTENADQYVLTADGRYTFLNQTSNELAHEFSKDITVTSEWQDIEDFYGGNQSFLTQPGTYIVQVYYTTNSANSMYEGYFSGIMSWYTGTTNSNNADEIVLHRVGHAYANTIYLRTRESLRDDPHPYTKLQISANSDLKQHTYKFKFKRIC